MGKYTWLIEPGHGGIIDGQYQTSTKWWKRSYFKNGELLNPKKHNLEWLEANNDLKYYEGVGNRGIARHLMNLMEKHKVRYYDVTDGSQLDLSLKYRVDKANEYYRTDKTCIYLSIHSDAFNVESAQGFSVYTSPDPTNSDKIAPHIFKEMAIEFADHKPRADYTDGDPDKEANFYVLTNTAMPAVLSENLFYTNFRECQILLSEEGQQRIAEAHFRGIMFIEKNGY